MPDDEISQRVVAAELTMSQPLADWRDAVWFINCNVLQGNCERSNCKTWLSHLKAHLQPQPSRCGGFPPVQLVSTTSFTSNTQYGLGHADVRYSEWTSFVKNCGGNVSLLLDGSAFPGSKPPSFPMKLEAPAFNPLQFAMSLPAHGECVQNVGIASQHKCLPDMPRREFVAFSSLRTGTELQYRNMALLLAQDALPWGAADVCQLLARTCWEAGAQVENDWKRAAHRHLADDGLAKTLLQDLGDILAKHESNWSQPWLPASIALVAARVQQLLPTTAPQVTTLLQRVREVALHWRSTVSELLEAEVRRGSQSSTATVEHRQRLVAVCAGGLLSYLPLLDDRPSSPLPDVSAFLDFRNTIFDNGARNAPASFERTILRLVDEIVLAVNDHVHAALSADPNVLDAFVARYLGDTPHQWRKTDSEWWLGANTPEVEISVLSGELLVQGQNATTLPVKFTSDSLYRRLFGTAVFGVHSVANDTYRSVALGDAPSFEFQWLPRRSEFPLQISLFGAQGEKWLLCPHTLVKQHLPAALADRFSHWALPSDGGRFSHLVFLPSALGQGRLDPDASPFRLDLGRTRELEDTADGRKLVPQAHPTCEFWLTVTSRLEHNKFVHVWTKDGQVALELVRLQRTLATDWKTPRDIRSKHHSGMCVDPNQSLGTLYGLTSGLLLRSQGNAAADDALRQRLLLLPLNCDVQPGEQIELRVADHAAEVRLLEFSLDAEDRLLSAPSLPQAWLLLTLLHAMTGQACPDTFTGMSGSEMAMVLLQSPRCAWHEPFDADCLKLLEKIAALSPRRKYSPKHLKKMQQVDKLQAGLSPWTAHEAYAPLAAHAIRQNMQSLPFFPNAQETVEFDKAIEAITKDRDPGLAGRAYARHCRWLGPQARLTPTFAHLLPTEEMRSSSWESKGWGQSVFHTARATAEAILLDGRHAAALENPEHLLGGPQGPVMEELNPVLAHHLEATSVSFNENFVSLAAHFSRQKPESWSSSTHLLSALAIHEPSMASSPRSLLLQILARFPCPGRVQLEPLETFEYRQGSFPPSAEASASQCFKRKSYDQPEPRPQPITTMYYTYTQQQRSDLEARVQQQFQEELAAHRACEAVFNQQVEEDRRKFNAAVAHHVEQYLVPTTQSFDPLNSGKRPPSYPPMQANFSLKQYTPDETASMTRNVNTLLQSAMQSALYLESFRGLCRVAKAEMCRFRQTFGPFTAPTWLQHPRVSCVLPKDAAAATPQVAYHAAPLASPDWEALKLLAPWGVGTSEPPAELLLSGDDPLTRSINDNLTKSFHSLAPRPAANSRALCAKLDELLKEVFRHIHSGLEPEGRADVQQWCRAGLLERPVPAVLLPRMLESVDGALARDLQTLVELRTWLQKARRIARMSPQDPLRQREIEDAHHDGWRTAERPEWALVELENNVSMRPVQARVAQRMLDGHEGKNAVVQLNMGEGKSAVILPAIAASLADGASLVRVIVPASLLRSTADALAKKLGGALGRRVYVLPCRREYKLSANVLRQLLELLKQCLQDRGVVVTTPEYILSMQLKAVELSHSKRDGHVEACELLRWLLLHARDVLDEADEVLHIKRQLVYTMGEQQWVDGHDQRWRVHQAVLGLVALHTPEMLRIFGPEVIEATPLPGLASLALPRLLEHPRQVEAYQWLRTRVLSSILRREAANVFVDLPIPPLTREVQDQALAFVLTPEMDGSDKDNAVSVFERFLATQVEDLCVLFRVLRGLFAYDVLRCVLSKRWRVDFGVNVGGRQANGQPRLMAVPFQAKDKATENTEFGHVDVAVLLTLLSYYRGGLTLGHFDAAFTLLHRLAEPSSEYARWIAFARQYGAEVPETLGEFGHVVLADHTQRLRLHELLRFNPRFVDYFLVTAVFPHEVKQFSHKLVATPWDLVSPSRARLLTGFSGTSDTQWHLPVNVQQSDLPELSGTKAAVITALLREENRRCLGLPANVTTQELLPVLAGCKATVLLDVGAVVMDDNEAFAVAWLLAQGASFEAVVFFRDGRLHVRQRDGTAQLLAMTPFEKNLDRCLIYLDEEHTRGTDLRVPLGRVAAVTLGARLTHDKFVQGCMRMRQVGRGHELVFLAAHDVFGQLQLLQSPPEARTVVQWVIRNMAQAIDAGTTHWVQQGAISARTEQFLNSPLAASRGSVLLECDKLLLKDAQTLQEAYACDRMRRSVPDICRAMTQELHESKQAEQMRYRCSTLFSDCKPRFFNLVDEEQERELEHETEEERQDERPPPRNPAKALVDKALLEAVGPAGGKMTAGLLPLSALFERLTGMPQSVKTMWTRCIRMSSGFLTTVEPQAIDWYSMSPQRQHNDGALNHFLRPVMWVVELADGVVLVSPAEAECVLRTLAENPATGVRLRAMVARVNFEQGNLWEEKRLWAGNSRGVRLVSDGPYALLALAQLHLVAGSLFLPDLETQAIAVAVLGICANPFSEDEQRAFDKKHIRLDGHVVPKRVHFQGKRKVVEQLRKRDAPGDTSTVPGFRQFLCSARNLTHFLPNTHLGLVLNQTTMAEPSERCQALAVSESVLHQKLLTVKLGHRRRRRQRREAAAARDRTTDAEGEEEEEDEEEEEEEGAGEAADDEEDGELQAPRDLAHMCRVYQVTPSPIFEFLMAAHS